jgi:hypothetical protein
MRTTIQGEINFNRLKSFDDFDKIPLIIVRIPDLVAIDYIVLELFLQFTAEQPEKKLGKLKKTPREGTGVFSNDESTMLLRRPFLEFEADLFL